MQLLSLVVVCAYSLIALGVGVKLVLMSRQTRRGPELLVGLAFLAGGMVGYPFNIAATVLWGSNADLALAAYAVGQTGMAGSAVLALASWQVMFAPSSRRARVFLCVWGVAMAALLVVGIRTTQPDPSRFASSWYALLLFWQLTCYAVLAVAALHHAFMLHRREALGLSDPVVTNRMLFWGITEISVSLQYLITLCSIAMAKLGMAGFFSPLIIASLGVIAAAATYVAFATRTAGVSWTRTELGARAEG
ncbi:MAG: hypothetical protein QNK05_25920 [Myxococcota bacterium]|nr:hypothetical protein [Myxococcota bacterium]